MEREHRTSDSRDYKDRHSRDSKDYKDRDSRESRESRDKRNSRDHNDRVPREPRESRHSRDYKDRDYKDSRDSREYDRSSKDDRINRDDKREDRRDFESNRRDHRRDSQDQREPRQFDRKRHDADDRMPDLYSIHQGTIVSVHGYGAFIEISGFKKQGLLHISQISFYKVDSLEGYFDQGEKIFVKVISIGGDGKIGLSMKYADQRTGEDLDKERIKLDQEQSKNKKSFVNKKSGSEAFDDPIYAMKSSEGGKFAFEHAQAMFEKKGQSKTYDLIPEDFGENLKPTKSSSHSHKKSK